MAFTELEDLNVKLPHLLVKLYSPQGNKHEYNTTACTLGCTYLSSNVCSNVVVSEVWAGNKVQHRVACIMIATDNLTILRRYSCSPNLLARDSS